MAEKKSNWKLILNGRPYRDGVFEEGISLATDLWRSGRGKVVYGFTSRKELERWAKRNGQLNAVRRGHKRLTQATKLSDAKHDATNRGQVAKLRRDTSRTKQILAARKVKSSDHAQILALARKKVLGSVFLYDRTNFRGPFLQLHNTIPGPTHSYARLSPHGWNDRAESVINTGPQPVVLCQHTYYRGSRLWVGPWTTDSDLGWFNNRASSVLVI